MERRFGRRGFIKGAALVGAAGAVGVFPSAAEARHAPPTAERVTFGVPGLDPAHHGLRVAQLSDLHVGPRTPDEVVRAAIAEANAFEPDLVVLTGDYLSHSRRELDAMHALLGGLAAPTIAVLGNHDVWVDPKGATAALRGHGYEVLENAWTTVRLRGAPFTIVGVGDHRTRRDDVRRAVKGLTGPTPLVLAHGPRTAQKLERLDRPSLCLSGHTHGGQINIPIFTPLFLAAVVREPFLRGRYALEGGVQLYVNRGIGMSGIRVRVNSPPEVTLATLERAEPA